MNSSLGLVVSDGHGSGQAHAEHFKLHHYASGFMLPVIGVVALCFTIVRGLHHVHWIPIPESGIVLVLGAIFGCIVSWSHTKLEIDSWDEIGASASLSMNFVLLPILIFQAGWTLNLRDFYTQLGAILLFAVLGTAISAVVIYWIMFFCSPADIGWSERKHLGELTAFASMISAVDPVATLTTFQSLGVERFLNIIVLGEALINDAVALVLFEGFNEVSGEQMEGKKQVSYVSSALEMLWQLCGSAGLGIILAVGLTMLFRMGQFQESEQQVAVVQVLLSAFVLYISAAALQLSGIIATLFGSAVMGVYVRQYLAHEVVREHMDSALEALAHLADLVIFAMVGLGSVVGLHWEEKDVGRVMRMSFMVFFACLVGRAVAIYPLAFARNMLHRLRRRRWDPEDVREYWLTTSRAHVMCWGGGLRGAIALVCALELNGEHKTLLVDVTMINIFLTVLIFGGTTEHLVRYLGIPLEDNAAAALPAPTRVDTGIVEGLPLSEDADPSPQAPDMYATEVPAYQQAMIQKVHHKTLKMLGQKTSEGDDKSKWSVIRQSVASKSVLERGSTAASSSSAGAGASIEMGTMEGEGESAADSGEQPTSDAVRPLETRARTMGMF